VANSDDFFDRIGPGPLSQENRAAAYDPVGSLRRRMTPSADFDPLEPDPDMEMFQNSHFKREGDLDPGFDFLRGSMAGFFEDDMSLTRSIAQNAAVKFPTNPNFTTRDRDGNIQLSVPEVVDPRWTKLSEQQRRQYLEEEKDVRNQAFRRRIGAPLSNEEESLSFKVGEALGHLSSWIADPSSVAGAALIGAKAVGAAGSRLAASIPEAIRQGAFGKMAEFTAKNLPGTILSGAFAGSEWVSYDLSKTGKIDPEATAIAAIGGAAAYMAVAAGGPWVTEFLTNKRRSGKRISPEELKAYEDHVGHNMYPEPERGVMHLNHNLIDHHVPEPPRDDMDFFVSRWSEQPGEALVRKTDEWRNGGPKFATDDDVDRFMKAMPMDDDIPSTLYKNEALDRAAVREANKTGGSVDEIVDTYRDQLGNSERGFANLHLLTTLASSGIGAGTGYAWNGPEGALIGALAGGSLPFAVRKSYGLSRKVIGKASDTLNAAHKMSYHYATGMALVTPRTHLKRLGIVGKGLSRTLDHYHTTVNRRGAQFMAGLRMRMIKDGLGKANPENRKAVMEFLTKKRSFSGGPMSGAEATAKHLFNQFNKLTREMADVGVITKEEANGIIRSRREHGFHPGLLNDTYMTSRAGKKKWREQFGGRWSEEEMQETISKLVPRPKGVKESLSPKENLEAALDLVGGVKSSKVRRRAKVAEKEAQALGTLNNILHGVIRNEDGTVSLSKHASDLLWNEWNKSPFRLAQRFTSKNDAPSAILKPFQLEDPYALAQTYMNHAHARIERARQFGPNDEIADQAFKEISRIEDVGDVADNLKVAQQTYWTTMQDHRSDLIKSAANINRHWRAVQSSINGFETLKMVYGQISNLGGVVNTATKLTRMTGNPITAFRASIKGILKTLSPAERREVLDRTGAAFEVTAMEHFGGLNRVSDSIFGMENMQGHFKYAETLTNPTKFLQVTGFFETERLLRSFSANIGQAYAEDLIEKFARIESGQIARSSKQGKKIIAQMDEMGIPSQGKVTDIPESAVDDAAALFSNQTNFSSQTQDFPLLWQSPQLRVFMKYKQFTIKQASFMMENVFKPITRALFKHGPAHPIEAMKELAAPLMYFGVGVPIVGMPIDAFKRFLRGDDDEYTMLEKYARGISQLGTMAIATDLFLEGDYGKVGPLAQVMGPGAGDLSELAYQTSRTLDDGDLTRVPKALLRATMSPMKQLVPHPDSKQADYPPDWDDLI
jgi:hypothetical protein